ncbi:GNAT family N-acetyltransferase, partial [Candidatus Bathyarchaeota archaeon]|nr:GNAT family N-acetyltransferase [Candidatus Bathyarchaeota archaeon]
PFGWLVGVAEDQKRIVGHMALISSDFKVADKVILGSQAVDLIVDPEYRGQGIFLSIGKFLTSEAARRGTSFWYGFPNKLAHSGHLKYGWFDVCQIPLLVKPIDTNKMINAFLAKHGRTRFLTLYRIVGAVARVMMRIALSSTAFFQRVFIPIRGKLVEKECQQFPSKLVDGRFDAFWGKVSRNYPILVARTGKYLRWRYFEKPSSHYRFLVVVEGDDVVGYVVLESKQEDGLKSGYIVDIFASPDDENTIRLLVLKAIELFKEEKVDLVNCWMLKDGKCTKTYYKILRYYGFMRLFGRNHPLIARINLPEVAPDIVRDHRNWFVTIGDSDHI